MSRLCYLFQTFYRYGETIQQFKIGRKRKANRDLNPKRSKIFREGQPPVEPINDRKNHSRKTFICHVIDIC